MDNYQNTLCLTQDQIQELANQYSPVSANEYQLRWEAISDSWDALTLIMDIQAHRISSSGFEISLTPTVSDTPPAVSSTQAWQPPSDGIPELQEHWARLENVQHSIADLTNVTESLSIEHCRILASIERMLEWIIDLEFKTSSGEMIIKDSAELFKLKAKYQALTEDVDKKNAEFRKLYNDCNDFLNQVDYHKDSKELEEKVSKLSNLWMKVTNDVAEKHNILQDASHKYGEFR
ncbi:unnamed protein product, partial [Nesidiocoris tenuis]